jgi:hypothetical protein
LIEVGNKIGEVKGDDEDDDKKGNLSEDTREGKPIFIVSP